MSIEIYFLLFFGGLLIVSNFYSVVYHVLFIKKSIVKKAVGIVLCVVDFLLILICSYHVTQYNSALFASYHLFNIILLLVFVYFIREITFKFFLKFERGV